VMDQLHRCSPAAASAAGNGLPEKILQFGGGVFLRGFVADFVDRALRAGHFAGRIVIGHDLTEIEV